MDITAELERLRQVTEEAQAAIAIWKPEWGDCTKPDEVEKGDAAA